MRRDVTDGSATGHATATENREPIGNREDLRQLVTDEHDGVTVGGEATHESGQLVPFARTQRGAGLVEDEHPRASAQQFDDLESLLLAH